MQQTFCLTIEGLVSRWTVCQWLQSCYEGTWSTTSILKTRAYALAVHGGESLPQISRSRDPGTENAHSSR
ncbi:unnamed protein product [Durusdinium trenchii]|uniref:Uncharacterized protein n=1 Tax=Durusdinium trenchii TaxID=1381693 RepID=A0ABP0IMW9_9DINO